MSASCALASVLLHLTLLTTALCGGGWPSRPPDHPRGLASDHAPLADEIALQAVAIEQEATEAPRAAPPDLSAPSLRPIAVADLAVLAADMPEQSASRSSASAAVSAGVSAAVGQYLGQINARIDRAWMKPAEALGEERFLCQVRIEQDPAGNVQEVRLERCNGSTAWQLSLVHAIESASPLPAPADPAVFARALHLSFAAEAPAPAVVAEGADRGARPENPSRGSIPSVTE